MSGTAAAAAGPSGQPRTGLYNNNYYESSTQQCWGSGMFIRNFFHPGYRIRIFSIPDTGPASKNLSILRLKIDFEALGNMI
jgi:hypothetical protein